MAYQPSYQAAKKVATLVERHFKNHLAQAAAADEQDLANAPSARVIEQMLDAAFWTSLRKEEGHSPQISMAYLPPEQAGKPLVFDQHLPLNAAILTKLAPGVERAGIHLGVWMYDGDLQVWGTTLKIPNLCFVLDVPEPGLLVVKHRRMYGLGKFTNVAILKGDDVKIVDESSANMPECPKILRHLLAYNTSVPWNDSVNVLIQLAISMRQHGRGGLLLVVPTENNSWRDSIIQPMQYVIEPAFTGLADLVFQDDQDTSDILWKSALTREIDNIGGLTAVDGATIISSKHALLAFGVKISMAKGGSRVSAMSLTEPIIGGDAVVLHPAQSGGTRHLSAAQFVHDQRDSLAMVASQDGHFTVFTWSEMKNMVQAHRIDTLLL